MLFVLLKKLFSFLRYSNTYTFVFLPFFLFDQCWIYKRDWLQKKLKVDDFIMCVYTRIEKHKWFSILRSKEDLMLNLGQLIKYYMKKIFIEEYAENMPQKLF